ncbi:MAG: hypothetical protein ABSE73_31975 [Planctomycetota bacterium]
MNTTKRISIPAVVLGLLLLGAIAVSTNFWPVRAEERHPHIRAAIKELRESKTELEKADHDFGGHRAEAVKSVEHAVKQLEKCMEFAK